MSARFPSIDALPAHHRAQAARQLAPIVPPRLATVAANDAQTPRAPAKRRRDDEHNEQVVFFNRIRTLAMNDARFADAAARTFAIPNGGGRSKREAGRLKAEGVLSGVSDIFCAVPSDGRHGLFLEMKSLTGYPSREQREWIAASERHGYAAACCRGADEAMRVWREYVEQGTT